LLATGLSKRKGRDTTEIIEKFIELEEEKDKKMEEQTKKLQEKREEE